MSPKDPLLQKSIALLESLPNIQIEAAVTREPYFEEHVLADGKITIKAFNRSVDYICEIKTGITYDFVEQLEKYFYHLRDRLQPDQRPLLITRSLSNLVVDQLIEKNIEFIDVEGNLYLNSREIYLMIRNQVTKSRPSQRIEITAADLQVIYVFLSEPNYFSKNLLPESEVAYLAGTTGKTVKSTLKKLQLLDYVKNRSGSYEIIDYVELFERWELGYSDRLRKKLLIETFSPIGNQAFSEVAARVKDLAEDYGYLISGELAAEIMTNHLRSTGAALYLKQGTNERELAVKLKLKPDPEGNVVFLQSFGNPGFQRNSFQESGQFLSSPLLIHAELVHAGDSRLREAAHLIYDRYIENLQQ